MKKIIALLLILAMLCPLLCACGGRQEANPSQEVQTVSPQEEIQATSEEMDEITHNLFADWYGYLIRCESVYGDMLWALSYLHRFFQDLSWGSLQIARAALVSANPETARSIPLEARMTSEDYAKILPISSDLVIVQNAVDYIPTLFSSEQISYQVYENYLNSPSDSFYLTYDLSRFKEWAELKSRLYDIELQVCAAETDWLLLTLDNDEEEAKLLDAVTTMCPQIDARRRENPQDPEALEQKVAALGDELESLTSELSVVLGQSQSGLDLYSDIADLLAAGDTGSLTQYIDALAADAVSLKGFPQALPYPDWWYAESDLEPVYFWAEPCFGEERSLHIPLPGDTIDTPPDICYYIWADVPLEGYQSYLKTLESYQAVPQYVSEEGGAWSAYFDLGTAAFWLNWQDNTVELLTESGSGCLVCLAPVWYVYLTNPPEWYALYNAIPTAS